MSEVIDFKPNVPRTPSPSPSPSCPDYSPSLFPSPSKSKSSPKKRTSYHPTPKPKTPSSSPRKRGRPAGTPSKGSIDGRKTGSWTKGEIRALWDAVIVIPNAVTWATVADQVQGRDKLSCSNKWRYDLLPKVQAFVDSLGD